MSGLRRVLSQLAEASRNTSRARGVQQQLVRKLHTGEHRHSYGQEQQWRNVGAALAAALAVGGATALTDADWHSLPVPGKKEDSGKRPGARFASLPDMIEASFPALCKIQGAIGDRAYGWSSAALCMCCASLHDVAG